MKRNTRISALLLLIAALTLFGTQIVFGQDAAPVEVEETFDFEPILVDYIANLPDGFSGVRADMAYVELIGEEPPFLIDLRGEAEFADGGYIEGAVNIPLRELTQNLDKLPAQDQPIIVYCGIGHRGAMALEVLQLLGYTNVRSISGGFKAWKTAELPVAEGAPPMPEVSGAPAPEFDADLFEALDLYVTELPDGFYGVTPTDALRALAGEPTPLLIDVRGAQELVDNGTIDGEVNIPLRDLLADLEALPQDFDQPIIVFCAVGHRGALAMTTLQLLGYTNVTSIGGGFNNWVSSGLPIIAPEAAAS